MSDTAVSPDGDMALERQPVGAQCRQPSAGATARRVRADASVAPSAQRGLGPIGILALVFVGSRSR